MNVQLKGGKGGFGLTRPETETPGHTSEETREEGERQVRDWNCIYRWRWGIKSIQVYGQEYMKNRNVAEEYLNN